jgi:hypothetical protein
MTRDWSIRFAIFLAELIRTGSRSDRVILALTTIGYRKPGRYGSRF